MAKSEPHSIVLKDITGDGLPELIFFAKYNSMHADLFIYTYENGAAKELFRGLDWRPSNAMNASCLYQLEGSNELVAVTRNGTGGPCDYYVLSYEDGTINESSLEQFGSGERAKFLLNGNLIDALQFAEISRVLSENPAELLMYTYYIGEYDDAEDLDGRDLIGARDMECAALTYDEAIALLQGGGAAADAAESPEFADESPAGEDVPASENVPASEDVPAQEHTEQPAASQEYGADRNAAYAAILRENELRIRNYMQVGDWSIGAFYPEGEPRSVALADITGDGVEELIFLASDVEDAKLTEDPMLARTLSDKAGSTLYIYTWENGALRQLLCHTSWDPKGESPGVFCLYQMEEGGELFGAVGGNSLGFYYWYMDGTGLQEESVLRKYMGADREYFLSQHNINDSWTLTGMGNNWDQAYGADKWHYYINDQETNMSTFGEAYSALSGGAANVVLYTRHEDDAEFYFAWDGRELIGAQDMESIAMTYDEAIAALTGGELPAASGEEEVYTTEAAAVAGTSENAHAYREGFPNALAAYSEILRENEFGIRTYWQDYNSYYFTSELSYARVGLELDDLYELMTKEEPADITLVDLVGDETEELIFITRDNEDTATLHIYTFDSANGALRELIHLEQWDYWMGSAGINCLYQVEGWGEANGLPDGRCLFGSVDGYRTGFYVWYTLDGVTLQQESMLIERGPHGDNAYSLNDEYVDDARFEAWINESFSAAPTQVLLKTTYYKKLSEYDPWWSEIMQSLTKAADGMEPLAFTYAQAMEMLSAGLGTSAEAETAGAAEVSANLPEYDPAYREAYEAYAKVLQENELQIRIYLQAGGHRAGKVVAEPRGIVLADVMGDETPELIFAKGEENFTYAMLEVYAFNSYEAYQAASVDLEGYVNQGILTPTVSCVYQVEGSKDLCIASSGLYSGFVHMYSNDGYTMAREEISKEPDLEGNIYWLDMGEGELMEISEEDYENAAAGFPKNASRILMYSHTDDDLMDGRDAIGARGMEAMAMTYEEAIAFLSGK